MAYTFFPKTASEIKLTLKGDKNKINDIINIFAYNIKNITFKFHYNVYR